MLMAGAGLGAGMAALSNNKRWKEEGGKDLREAAFRNAAVADLMFAGAAVVAVATTVGAILVWRKKKKRERAAMLVPSCGPAGCGVLVRGRF